MITAIPLRTSHRLGMVITHTTASDTLLQTLLCLGRVVHAPLQHCLEAGEDGEWVDLGVEVVAEAVVGVGEGEAGLRQGRADLAYALTVGIPPLT